MENLGLLRKIVWSFIPETKSNFDDLFQEACLEYFRCLEDYDTTRGKVSTFVWWRVSSHLKNVLHDQRTERSRLLPIDETVMNEGFLPLSFMERLTDDAQKIAALVLKESNLFLIRKPEDKKTLKENYSRLTALLQSQGWDNQKISSGIKSLQIACS